LPGKKEKRQWGGWKGWSYPLLAINQITKPQALAGLRFFVLL